MNRRVPVVVILIGAVIAALVVDRARDDTAVEATAEVPDASVFPIASEPDALSSTWFCAGGTADEEQFADHTVVVANPTSAPVEVTLTAFGGFVEQPTEPVEGEEAEEEPPAEEPEAPDPVVHTVEVPAKSRRSIALSDLIGTPVASALVESSGGGVVVEHEVRSIHGYAAKPCVTSAASNWHFAWGDTTADAREMLVLFNPFPDDAIVDGRFSTEQGARAPQRWNPLLVPGRSTVAIDLGDDVTRREEVASTITARNGRKIVVDRILRLDGDPDRGLTVQSGVPEPQLAWVYPHGFVSDAVREEYVVYNPGEELAEVEITFIVDDPEENGIPAPVELSLPPGTHQVVDIRADGRIPDFVEHSAIVRSLNGVPVVSERVHYSDGRARRGVSVTTGSPVEAERWNFAAGAVTDDTDEWLVLVNLDPQILAEIDVAAVSGGERIPIPGLQGIELGARERLAIELDEHITEREDLALVVTSTEPIVAERNLYLVGDDQRGISSAVGIPSPSGLRLPPDPLEAGTGGALVPADDDAPDDAPDVPDAPEDVDLPAPDETIVIEDPDATAEDQTDPTDTG